MLTGTLIRDDRSCAVRRRPALFRALGDADPPAEIEVRGCRLRQVSVFKHDSWAATALYRGEGHCVVCKFNRQEPILGIPMGWLGRLLARREARMLKLLAAEPNVPAGCGAVRVHGRRCVTAVAHEYVPGRPLRRGDRVDVRFFQELDRLIQGIHDLGIAYVDLHKRENILVGADGRPYLIDFQISVRLPRVWPLRGLLRILQESDRYHLAKHRHRQGYSPSGPENSTARPRRPWWISLHRKLAIPFRTLRRRLLVVAGIRAGAGKANSEALPEVAFRDAA